MSVLRQSVQIKSANKFSALDADHDDAITVSNSGSGVGSHASANSHSASTASRVRFAESHAGPAAVSPKSGGKKSNLRSTGQAPESQDYNTTTTATTTTAAAAGTTTTSGLVGAPGIGKAAMILSAQGYTLDEIETAHVLMIAGGWIYDDSLGLDYDTALALAMMDYFKAQQAAIEEEAKAKAKAKEQAEAARNTSTRGIAKNATPAKEKSAPAAVTPSTKSATITPARNNTNAKPATTAVSEEKSAAKSEEAVVAKPQVIESTPEVPETLAPSPVNALTSSPKALASGDVSAADDDEDDENDNEASSIVAAAATAVPPISAPSTALSSPKTSSAPEVVEEKAVHSAANNDMAAETKSSSSPDIPFQDVSDVATNDTVQSSESDAGTFSLELEQSGPALEGLATIWSPEANEDHRLLLAQWSATLGALELEATIARAKLARAAPALLNALAVDQPPQQSQTLNQQQQSQLAELRKARDTLVRFISVLNALGTSRALDLLVIRLLGGVVTSIAHLRQQIGEAETAGSANSTNSSFFNLAGSKANLNQLTSTLNAVLPPLIDLHDRALGTSANQSGKASFYHDLINSLITGGEALLDVDMNSKAQNAGGLFAASLANLLATSRGTLSSIRRLEVQLAIISAGVPANIFPATTFSITNSRPTQKSSGAKSGDSSMSIDEIAVDLISPRLVDAAKQSPALAEAVKRAQSTRAELACSKELATLVNASQLIQKEAHDMQFALHVTERDLLSDVALVNQRAAALAALEQNYKTQRESALDTFTRSMTTQLSTGEAVRERREHLLQRKKQLERELAAINEELGGLDAPLHVVDEKIKLGVTAYLKVVRGIAVRCTVSAPQDEPSDAEVSAVTKAVVEKGAKGVSDLVDDMMLAAVRTQSKALEFRQRCHSKLESALLMAFSYLKSRVTFDSVSVQALASSALVPVAPSSNRSASQNYKRAFAQAFESHLRAAGDIAMILIQRVRTCEAMLSQQQSFRQAQQLPGSSGVLPAELEEQHNATFRHLADCIAGDQAELAKLNTSVQEWVSKTSRATALDHELVTLLTSALGRVINKNGQAQGKQAYPFDLQADYEVLSRFVQSVREKNSQKPADQQQSVVAQLSPHSSSSSSLSSPPIVTTTTAATSESPAKSPKSRKQPHQQQANQDSAVEKPQAPVQPKTPAGQSQMSFAAAAAASTSTTTGQSPDTKQRSSNNTSGRGNNSGTRGNFGPGRGGSRGGARAGGNV